MQGMRKGTKATVLLVVVIIAGLAWLWLRSDLFGSCAALSRMRRSYHAIVLGDKDFMGREVRFRSRGAGAVALSNGRLGGFTTLRASDCVDVIVEDDDEGSPEHAEAEMEKKIQKAVRLIERGPFIGPSGQLLGERAVLLEKEEPKAEIMSLVEGRRDLRLIRSTSLAHALALEKLKQNG